VADAANRFALFEDEAGVIQCCDQGVLFEVLAGHPGSTVKRASL